MSRSTVSGLQSALRAYDSEKVKERGEGAARLREIFSNRENLLNFDRTASRDGGEGWIALFQCLFQVVVLEKKNWLRKLNGGPQAEKRLGDAISLVRWLAERSVHLISRKPVQALITHMTTLLVYSGQLFAPAAIDYAKAIRSLLSYPPHLSELDSNTWFILAGVCWSAVLGDQITVDGEFDDNIAENDDPPVVPLPTQAPASLARGRSNVTQATNELAQLIPLLLSSSSAPVTPPLPISGTPYQCEQSLALTMSRKASRFFAQHSSETTSHLAIVRSTNHLLSTLEFNCRHDLVAAGVCLLPQLVDLWPTRNKAIREQILIALRTILPFLVHKTSLEKDRLGVVRSSLERLMDVLPKESISRWGFEAIDVNTVRLQIRPGTQKDPPWTQAFERRALRAGFDFTHDSALRWTIIELYSEVCYHLYHTIDPSNAVTPSRSDSTQSKRRKISDPLSSLLAATRHGAYGTRLQALQTVIFLIDNHWADVHLELQRDIRQQMIALLDEDEPSLQSWAFIGIATLATLPTQAASTVDVDALIPPPAAQARIGSTETDFARAWTYAIQKTGLVGVYRSACLAAHALLVYGKVGSTIAIKDIGFVLEGLDIRGPLLPLDSVCALLDEMLSLARQDVRLYTMGLEAKVISWFAKWNATEGIRGKGRIDQHFPSDILPLLCNSAHLQAPVFHQPSTLDLLPDCAVVDRVLEEERTQPIRQFNLYGTISDTYNLYDPTRNPVASPEVDLSSAAFLDGAPRRISDTLNTLVEASCQAWPAPAEGDARPAIPADRCRRTADVLVLTLGFQASLHANGIRIDNACLQICLRLLDLLIPVLRSTGYDILSQHLMWKGLEPLVRSATHFASPIWPILLRPTEMSGVRKDILPLAEELDADGFEEGMSREDDFLATLWALPHVANALRNLSDAALSLFAGSDAPSSVDTSQPNGTREDDDDFGEIRIAETDAIPVSQEASECQRTTFSLLSILVQFRLRQAILISPNRTPSVDKDLMNAFLGAEGPRFVQLGSVICDAVKDGVLRLTANTVNVTLERLEDVTQSYVYRGHEGLLRMALAFMTGSIVVWLSPQGDKYELLQRTLLLANTFHLRAERNALPSWRVRLDLVRFVDEYFDYDPDQEAWMDFANNQMDVDGVAPSATDLIAAALMDVDSRVRFRGATSAAGTMYLPCLRPDDHSPVYHAHVDEQPRDLQHWDTFITDILYKLNCCVTSPQVRAATIYHLYEVPQTTHDYDRHLENGLKTVATRLGLKGIAPLSLAYVPLIFMSQISAQQSPMRVPHRLYGFSTRKDFATRALEAAGSQLVLLAVAELVRSDPDSRQFVGAGDTLSGICAAAGIPSADVIMRHFPAAAAHMLADPESPPFYNNTDGKASEHALRVMTSIHGLIPGAVPPKDPLAYCVEQVITNLFIFLDLSKTDEEIVDILRGKVEVNSGAHAVYARLSSSLPIVASSSMALMPNASAEHMIDAWIFLTQTYKTTSSAKVLFNTLTRLFHRVNDDFLISEQHRHLRGIALAVSLYGDDLAHPAVLGFYLRETLPLLRLPGIAPIILSMLRFGFEHIKSAPKAPDDLDQFIIALGSTRDALTQHDSNAGLVSEFDEWIVKQAPAWQDVEAMRPALTVARSTWPSHLADVLDGVGSPSFIEICDNTEQLNTSDVLPMCEAMLKSLDPDPSRRKEDLEQFQRGAFWHIKQQLVAKPRNTDSVSAFIDLLYAGNGQVHPPGLEMTQLPPGIAWLRDMLRKKEVHPARALRTLMLDRIVLMARLPEYQARTAALSTLQMLLWCMQDEKEKKSGHGTEKSSSHATNDLLILLTPVAPPPSPSAVPAFSTLATDDAWLRHARDASTWSSALATFIATTLSVRERFYAALPELFGAIPSAAGDLLPLLVQTSLAVEVDQRNDLRERHATYTKYLTKVLASSQSSVDTMRVVVDISLHLRYLNPPYKRSDELAFEKWLDIDPMLLSEAALRCGNYATALMYLENVRSDAKHARREVDMFDKRVQDILYESYSNVEDPDGFYGIQTHDVFDHLHRRVQHEGDHWRSFGLHGALLESDSGPSETSSTSLLAMCDLHKLGFNQVANSIFASIKSTDDKTDGAAASSTDPLLFELAWRTSDWDLPLPPRGSSDTLLYTALRAVHRERDLSVAVGIVNGAISIELEVLRDCGAERTGMIKKSVNNLICLNEVKKWIAGGQLPASVSTIESTGEIENGWGRVAHLDEAFAFADAERIMATRRSLIAAARSREAPQVFGDLDTPRLALLNTLDIQALLRTGQLARAEGNIQASINALVAATKLDSATVVRSEAVQDEFARVLWAQNEHMLAIQHVDERVKRVRKADDAGGRLAVLLGQMAHWTSRAKSRAPPDIRSIFEEALQLAEVHKLSTAEMGELFHNLAAFADGHQRDLSRSPEIEKLNSVVSLRESGDARMSTPGPSKRATKSSTRTDMTDQLDRELREEEEAVMAILASRSNYATLALRSFAKSLAFSDKYDDSMTRMISLWLEFDEDEDVNTAFSGPLSRVPSHKFLFLSPQLSARLDRNNNMTPFNNALNALVYRICQQHPYHILYQVITLADGAPKTTAKGKRVSGIGGGEGRGAAAAAILATLAASSDKDTTLARKASHGMRQLADAASRWCLVKRKEEEQPTIGRSLDVPMNCPLRHLPTSLGIPVATAPPAPDPTGKYEHIPTLVRYRSSYVVLGGIHRPKRMQVYDSNGVLHRELFKGEDELRQDAVMEQVFEMSNALLRRDRKTRERDLRFRTYVVIPLANKTGIMEFVGDSQAIGDWLKPAHKRYGVANGDIDADEIRRSLKPLQDKEKLWNQLPAKFAECIDNFHPVMRHFFTEKHRDPMAWFTMRLNYTRSVAVTSIIGWILGVGDRHCSNILIDQKTGELVHIDFGIVFEDGRRLRIPEKVPFRLTNDLVDGFGLMGVEGTFRRCSEHTLRVLRESSEVIMTVLEVFKHDPLYAWDADPEKLLRAQGGGRVSAGSTTSASALEKADRILSKIRGKLRPDLSIEYTVNQLIQEARDVDNLAKIFVGWQPWF